MLGGFTLSNEGFVRLPGLRDLLADQYLGRDTQPLMQTSNHGDGEERLRDKTSDTLDANPI